MRVFIDGAAGTTGLEIHERLTPRDEFDLIVLDDAERKDESARREALHEADVAILCLPDAAAREAVALAQGSNTRIIDASSAHRVADGWTYGFPEIIGQEAVANAQFVSNPGCYPTGFLALVAPLVQAGLLPADWPYTVNAVSGYSGGGNALIETFEENPEIAFHAYGIYLGHKHLPEMQTYASLVYRPVFSPAVIPARRGMVVDVPLPMEAMKCASADQMRERLIEFYSPHEVITAWPETGRRKHQRIDRSMSPFDGMHVWISANEDGSQARLMAMLDNLGKGAGGAAIQNLNIMCGLPETTGLRL